MTPKEVEARIGVLERLVDRLLFRSGQAIEEVDAATHPGIDNEATRFLLEEWRNRYRPLPKDLGGEMIDQEKRRAAVFDQDER